MVLSFTVRLDDRRSYLGDSTHKGYWHFVRMTIQRRRTVLFLLVVASYIHLPAAWNMIRDTWALSRRGRTQAALQSNAHHSSSSLFALPEPVARKAYPQQPPHTGRHFTPSHPAAQYRRRRHWRFLRRRRFMEGWYYRLTLPDDNISFVFIVSIEDPGNTSSNLTLSCIQVIGPNDEYLVQADRDDTRFWAWKHQMGLGCVFQWQPHEDAAELKATAAQTKDEFNRRVVSGFQVLPHHLIGRVHGHDGSRGGVLPGMGVEGSCEFDFTVEPLCGWGESPTTNGTDNYQTSTGGWLSSFAVFEPHWQVILADARATGTVTWQNRTYTFANAPFYAEKNWGAALPQKWYWTQCNSFPGYEQLSVTAGGGIRKIPFGRRESLGMVSIHYNGKFYEGTPWTGNMEWKVQPFGSWELKGYGTGRHPFEAVVTYTCDPKATPGLVFRAPTPDEGMVLFCRATFEAKCTLTLWELEWNANKKVFERKPGRPLIDGATSRQGGAEVGGGPWWDRWAGESKLKQPIRGLLRFPFRVGSMLRRIRNR